MFVVTLNSQSPIITDWPGFKSRSLPLGRELAWLQGLSLLLKDQVISMAAHSSILAWRISWTEEAGGLQSIG